MAIRHWHPLKLGIIWLIDLALFLVLWLLASPYSGGDQAFVIVVWLTLSIPMFVITWKWASGRETGECIPLSGQDRKSRSKFRTLFWQVSEEVLVPLSGVALMVLVLIVSVAFGSTLKDVIPTDLLAIPILILFFVGFWFVTKLFDRLP